MNNTQKLKIGIIGTGNIGTDLLIKVMRSKTLECTLFSGRNLNSAGIRKANELGVKVTDRGVQAIIDDPSLCDLVFDATSAHAHIEHWKVLEPLGITAIDLTPAKIGQFCIPAINAKKSLKSGDANFNMITCGGQSSIPIAYVFSQVHSEIEYIEVASSIASRSAGPATRLNLDEYIDTTEQALKDLTGCKKAKAILILNPAIPPIDMQTTIYAKIRHPDIVAIENAVSDMVAKLQSYVPGYELLVPPFIQADKVVTTIKVEGNGDYLPQYAGNLDIINCAAISLAELIAENGKGMGD